MFRLHLWAFVVGNLALNATNWFAGGDWWACWPLAIWSVVLVAHYLAYKSKRVTDRWVDERAEDLRSKSYDAAHIDTIRKDASSGPGTGSRE